MLLEQILVDVWFCGGGDHGAVGVERVHELLGIAVEPCAQAVEEAVDFAVAVDGCQGDTVEVVEDDFLTCLGSVGSVEVCADGG